MGSAWSALRVEERGAVTGAGRFRLGYRPSLDGLRAIAVMVVIVTHSFWLYPWLGLHHVVSGGYIGVDAFFGLSGFLITCLLLEEFGAGHRIRLGAFYFRRVFRLLPALVLLLIGITTIDLLYGSFYQRDLNVWLYSLTYSSNWVQAISHASTSLNYSFDHLWSLAVEEQFYVVWPPILAMLLWRRVRRDVIIAGCVAAFAAVGLWRAYLAGTPHVDLHALYIRTDTRADAILGGVILALIINRGWLNVRVARVGFWIASACLAFIILFAHQNSLWMYEFGFSLVAIAVPLVILGALASVRGTGPLSWRPVVSIGQRSYGLYLWHLPIFVFISRHYLVWPVPIRIAVAWGATFAVSYASYRFVESPIRRAGRDWLQHRANAQVAARSSSLDVTPSGRDAADGSAVVEASAKVTTEPPPILAEGVGGASP